MKVTPVPAGELSAELRATWIRLQESDPRLVSPFLRPEFVQAVASACEGVYVGVVEDGATPVGFLPFQRGPLRSGLPVGAPLNECQALVGRLDGLDARAFVTGCDLVSLELDHLLAHQSEFTSHHTEVVESPVIELPSGWEAYRTAVARTGSNLIRQAERKRRKLAREVGPLRFEAHVEDADVLQRLLAWKSAQCQRTGIFDVFRFDWPNRMLQTLHRTEAPGFAGRLSAVYAGEELVAAHFGLVSGGVWHWWFPAYDPRWARYSPGVTLLLEMARASTELGVRRIDLGRGTEPYKRRACTGSIAQAQARVECPSLVTSVRRLRRGTMAALRGSPLSVPAEALARLVRRGERWLRLR